MCYIYLSIVEYICSEYQNPGLRTDTLFVKMNIADTKMVMLFDDHNSELVITVLNRNRNVKNN